MTRVAMIMAGLLLASVVLVGCNPASDDRAPQRGGSASQSAAATPAAADAATPARELRSAQADKSLTAFGGRRD